MPDTPVCSLHVQPRPLVATSFPLYATCHLPPANWSRLPSPPTSPYHTGAQVFQGRWPNAALEAFPLPCPNAHQTPQRDEPAGPRRVPRPSRSACASSAAGSAAGVFTIAAIPESAP